MKLTNQQIETLYTFTRQHFVEWYDVQTELVDHLANGIEEQWELNSNLSFDEALKNEFKKFGIFGFSDVVEQKVKALNLYYRKEVWTCIKDYFKLPKIILTAFSIWSVFKLIHWADNKSLAGIIMVGLLCFYFFYIIKESSRIRKVQRQTGKKWLFEGVLLQLGGLIQMLNLGIYAPNIDYDKPWTTLSLSVFSVCLVMYVLLFFVSIKVVSPKLKEKFLKEYPEYNI